MRFLRSLIPSLLLLGAGVAEGTSSWSFEEASLSVNSKTGEAFKDKYVATRARELPAISGYGTDIDLQALRQVCSQGPGTIGCRRQS
jgi:hypothetical protein